jgi:cell division protein ZipA
MDELRWILLILGLMAIAAVGGFTYWQQQRRKGGDGRRREPFRDDRDFDKALEELDSVIVGDVGDVREVQPEPLMVDEIGEVRIIRDDRVAPEPPKPAAKPAPRPVLRERRPQPAAEEPAVKLEEKIVVLNVAATDGRLFGAQELVIALELAGLRFGEHDIYHRTLDTKNGPVSLFSAANILKPGTFELDRLDEQESPGIALFLQLPGPFDGLAAFEQMLEAGRRIADRLEVKLLDARRCDLSHQAIEHIREELLEYRRLAHLAAKKTV